MTESHSWVVMACSVVCVLKGPFFGGHVGLFEVVLPDLSDLLVEGVVHVGGSHKRLDREQHGSNLQSGRPLVLEDVEANAAKLVNVWMVNLCAEKNLGWHHRVLLGQEELAVEHAALKGGFAGTSDLDKEVAVILRVGFSINSHNWLLRQLGRLLHNSWVAHI